VKDTIQHQKDGSTQFTITSRFPSTLEIQNIIQKLHLIIQDVI